MHSDYQQPEYRLIETVADLVVYRDLHTQVRIVEDPNGGRRLDLCNVDATTGERRGGIRLNRQLAVALLKLLQDKEDQILTSLFPGTKSPASVKENK